MVLKKMLNDKLRLSTLQTMDSGFRRNDVVLCMKIIFFLLFFSFSAHAQTVSPSSSKAPLEITADETLEWHRNDKIFIAKGNVTTKQGDVSIKSATQSATYQETPETSFDLTTLKADGNVEIVSQGSTASGQTATYDVKKGVAVMTGNNLKMTSADQIVTARDRFEYETSVGKLSAIGTVHVIRGEDTLDADRASAVFRDDNATGKRVLDTLEATGNVVITTPEEVLKGAHGIYRSSTNKAEISGGVTITRGQNILQGDRAEVDLTTNISRIFGSPSQGGRVRGVFYPDSKGTPSPSSGSLTGHAP
jgi:lipopolysaccharide export system protein LptA